MMKAGNFLVLTAFSCRILSASLSAADNPPAPATDPLTYTFIDSADPSVAEIAKFGYDNIQHIGVLLITQVNHALATQETSQAVSVMHLKNLELPKPVAGQPTITAIKRTSMMLRDPRNAPDAADQAALELIHSQLTSDQTPDKMIVQRVDRPGLPVEWRVYRPIAASKSCLACHGDPKTFRPGVQEALDRLYPQDKAVDYAAQDWRGVIRVSLTAAIPAAK
jgi:Protein of unknown function (DUF3365)